jgi:polysaccharide chain length determinant protein (PEP-CTERM system associated)
MSHLESMRPDGGSTSRDPDYLWQVWRRRKWTGLVAFSAAAAATAGLVLSLPNLYRATATVLIERQDVSEALLRPPVTAELDTRIQTIHQRITSRDRLSALITDLGLYAEMRRTASMDAAVERMRREVELHLKGVDQSNGRTQTISFGLTYRGRDPALVANVANTLVASYIEENAQSRSRQATGTAEVFEEQAARAREAVDALDRRAAEFTARHGNELTPQLQANIATLDRTANELRANVDAQLRAVDRRDRFQSAMVATTADAASRAAGPDTLAAQLAKARRELAELRLTYTDAYPEIARVRGQIAALESLAGPAGTAAQPSIAALAEIDNELKQLKQQEASLRRIVVEYDARLQNTPAWQAKLEELTRGVGAARERHQTLLKQSTDARLAESLEQSQRLEQFRVLDPAVPPLIASAPDRQMLALMGIAASLGLGLAAMFLTEKLDTTFHSAADLSAFADLPVLATIRRIPTSVAVNRQRWRAVLVTCATLVAVVLIGAVAFYFAAGNERLVMLVANGGK